MNAPWLTVAMTTYNAGVYLKAALDSVAAQADDGVEVVVVDDGSADDTIAILESYRRRLDLRVIARSHTGNWIASMNEGLHTGRGRYACFLHHDDVWLPGRLEAARSAVAGDPEAVLLMSPSWFVDPAGARLNLWRCPLPEGRSPSPEFVVERLLVQNFIAVPAPVFRRGVALEVGGLDEENWHSADWDFWLKLAAAGPTTYVGRPLTGYRIHPVAATWRGTGRAAAYRWQMDNVLDRHFAAWEGRRPARRAVQRVARLSVEANLCLAAYAHGHRPGWSGVAGRFLALGPAGWHRYFRDSRIVERVGARLRAGVLHWGGVPGAPRTV